MSQTKTDATGRIRQKTRTRRHIVDAANRLQDKILSYTLEQVAEEAEVSRATVYRYFSNVSSLNAELALVVRIREPGELLDPSERDPLRRVLRVHAHLFELVCEHQPEFRAYIKGQLEHWERNESAREAPLREGRRARLLDAALAEYRIRLPADDYEKLIQSLSLLTFIEPFIVLKDIFGLTDAGVDEVLRWAIERLLAGALAPDPSCPDT